MAKTTVLAYTHLHRTTNPTTGVGKHVINMVRGLAAASQIDFRMIAPHDLLSADAQVPPQSMLHGLPVGRLPWRRSLLEQSSKTLNWPSIDRWIGAGDVVYSPAEVYLRTRKRLIVTAHDVVGLETDLPWSNQPAVRRNRSRWRALYRRLLNGGVELVTVSQFSRRRIVELTGFPEQRVHVVGNGVEERYFSSERPPPDAAAPRPYVMVIGITERKGGDAVLDLAEQLRVDKSPIQVVVIGALDEPYRPRAQALGNVVHLQAVPDERAAALMQHAVALLQLSRYEGFGIPVVEAMASGTPALVSSWSALPEIAGPAGLVFDLTQPNVNRAMADALRQLESDSGHRAEIVSRGRAWASRFHWSNCVDALLRVISQH